MDEPLDAGRARRRVAAIAFCFNFSYMGMGFLVPLYAQHLGYSLVSIGAIAALPSVLQMATRAVSGPLADTRGERLTLCVSASSGCLAGLVLTLFPGLLASLVVAQLAIGLARGFFWVSAQSYMTRLPGEASRSLGLLQASNNGGSLLGVVASGPVAAWAGFPVAFGLTAALQATCLILATGLPMPARPGARRSFLGVLALMPRAFTRRVLALSGGVAFLAAIPQALVQSFYPVDLSRIGVPINWVSPMTSLRSLGVIVAGLVATGVLVRFGRRASLTGMGILLGISIAATALGASWAAVCAALFLAGVSSGVMNILFQVIAADASRDQDRATNLAVVNFYIPLSMVATPLGFGFGAARVGFPASFVALGGVALAAGTLLAGGWRWFHAREGATPAGLPAQPAPAGR